MARRRGTAGKKKAKAARKSASTTRSVKRPSSRAGGKKRASAKRSRKRPAVKARKSARSTRKAAAPRARAGRSRVRPRAAAKAKGGEGTRPQPARLNRERRRLEEKMENVPTPPSSLDMERHGSAARTGRAELAERRHDHASLTPAITGGDVDVNVENAYFTGDETPGGDNPTPDQDVVDDIGRAIGIEYQDNEELRASDKVSARDRHRWELDPASAEDYKERK